MTDEGQTLNFVGEEYRDNQSWGGGGARGGGYSSIKIGRCVYLGYKSGPTLKDSCICKTYPK